MARKQTVTKRDGAYFPAAVTLMSGMWLGEADK